MKSVLVERPVRLPSWSKQPLPDSALLEKIGFFKRYNVRTICQEARCPNIYSCLRQEEATFLILGGVCTRSCRFCAVAKAKRPANLPDVNEPYRIAQAVKTLGLKYVVLTSITRDDLTDGGAGHFVKVIEAIQALGAGIKIEILIPDFLGDAAALKAVIDAGPSVVGHNIETVRRLHAELKPESDYGLSLKVLAKIKEINPYAITKSSIMLGLGEREDEVVVAMQDLRKSECDILTLGQYLSPGTSSVNVREFIGLEKFKEYKDIAEGLNFKAVRSAPLVRSSYKANELYDQCLKVVNYEL